MGFFKKRNTCNQAVREFFKGSLMLLLPQLTLEFSILLGEQNSASENLTIRQYSFGVLPCLLLPKLHIILQELVGGAIPLIFYSIFGRLSTDFLEILMNICGMQKSIRDVV